MSTMIGRRAFDHDVVFRPGSKEIEAGNRRRAAAF
jgi:hypothetical protein